MSSSRNSCLPSRTSVKESLPPSNSSSGSGDSANVNWIRTDIVQSKASARDNNSENGRFSRIPGRERPFAVTPDATAVTASPTISDTRAWENPGRGAFGGIQGSTALAPAPDDPPRDQGAEVSERLVARPGARSVLENGTEGPRLSARRAGGADRVRPRRKRVLLLAGRL